MEKEGELGTRPFPGAVREKLATSEGGREEEGRIYNICEKTSKRILYLGCYFVHSDMQKIKKRKN